MADFCTIADLEAFLQLEITTAAQVASAQRAITEATAAIKNYCHQEIELVEDDEITLDSYGGVRVFLPELPVTEVSEVEEDGELLVADDDYKLGQHGILWRVGRRWFEGIGALRIVYSHGWATLPDDVIAVAVRAASRTYQMGLNTAEFGGVTGIKSLSLGDYAVTYSEGSNNADTALTASGSRMLLLSEKDVLAKYRYVAL